MFDNSGRKIKNVTKILFWVLLVGSIIFGLIYCVDGDSEIGLLVLLFLPPLIWFVSLFVYSWGQHVEDVEKLKDYINAEYDNKKYKELIDNLLAQDLLTQEEYEKIRAGKMKIV